MTRISENKQLAKIQKKRCSRCKKVKSFSGFHVYPSEGTYCSHCKECESIRAKEWREANPLKKKKSSASYYFNNKEHCSKRMRKTQQNVRREVINHYGGKCQCCGEDTFEFLAIDHIHNNGAEERKRLGITGGWRFAYYLRKQNYPEGYQVLCHNCNSAKEFYGGCPHQNIFVNKRKCVRQRISTNIVSSER